MLRAFEPWHLVIIGGIATVLFGAKRLPDSARSLGQSLRILKSEVGAGHSSTDQAGKADQDEKADPPSPPTAVAPVVPLSAIPEAPAAQGQTPVIIPAAAGEKQTA